MKNEIKTTGTAFDVDDAMTDLTSSTIAVLSQLNSLYSSVHAHPTIASEVKIVIDYLKNSGVDLDDDEYCLDMDHLNVSLDREINRLNCLYSAVNPAIVLYENDASIEARRIASEVKIVIDNLQNIKKLNNDIIIYYNEHPI